MLIELMQKMQPYVDVCVSVSLLLGVVWGLYQGAIRMIFSALSWLLGVWLAFHYAAWAQQQLLAHIELPVWFMAIVLFVLVKIVVLIMGDVLYNTLDKIGLAFSDRLVGATLGLVQIMLILVWAWYLLNEWGLIGSWQHTYFDQFSRVIFKFFN
jgi:uncharacterized membrane protein required for colicin V production